MHSRLLAALRGSPVIRRFQKSALVAALALAGGFLAPRTEAATILIHQGVHWDWYTDSAVWNDATTRANVTALFDYFDGTFEQILTDWAPFTAPRTKYFLWVDPNTGGGFATGDIGQISTLRGVSPSPGIGISFDAFNNPNCGIARFWGYAIGTHENVNLLTGEALTPGWPRDWWADDKSPFPAMTAVNVEAVRAPAGVSACHDATFNDPLYTMMKNIQAHYGWGIFQRMFQAMKTDGIQWTAIDGGANPSAILTAYVTAYMFIGSGDASITTFLDGQFRTGGIPNYNMNTTLAVKAAHDCLVAGTGNRNNFLNGNYTQVCGSGGGTGVTFFQDINFGGASGNTLTAGDYTTAQLASQNVPNNWASSARVSSGFSVQMFDSDNFVGSIATLTADNANFTQIANGNDTMSSCRVTQGTGGTGVKFFQDINFGGTSGNTLPVGNYTTAQLAAQNVPNNWASSARVSAGFSVQMFDSDNFVGSIATLTADNANFTQIANGNDTLSSCRVTSGASGGVTFFQNSNFGGTASQQIGVGNYTLSQLQAKGVQNDWASSARVTSGRTVQMFQDDNFGGTMWTITSDTSSFSALSPSANDQLSSCKVQ